ncbi:hypothetical protein Tco_1222748 [Tanacetum coccineum]
MSYLVPLITVVFVVVAGCYLASVLQVEDHQSSSLAVTSSRLSYDVSDVGLPSEKVMTSGKNGDDGDLLLFRDGPGACDISARTLSVPWQLPVLGSCQARCWKVIETFLEYTLHTTE